MLPARHSSCKPSSMIKLDPHAFYYCIRNCTASGSHSATGALKEPAESFDISSPASRGRHRSRPVSTSADCCRVIGLDFITVSPDMRNIKVVQQAHSLLSDVCSARGHGSTKQRGHSLHTSMSAYPGVGWRMSPVTVDQLGVNNFQISIISGSLASPYSFRVQEPEPVAAS